MSLDEDDDGGGGGGGDDDSIKFSVLACIVVAFLPDCGILFQVRCTIWRFGRQLPIHYTYACGRCCHDAVQEQDAEPALVGTV